jgi:hypothetical protein
VAAHILRDFRAIDGVGFERDFFCRRTALEIVSMCETGRVKIWGIEGFYLTKHTTQPDMDWILNMSDAPYSYEFASKFLKDSSPLPLFFCLTVEEKEQPQPSMEESK